jgi:hypothetical protein
MEGYRFSEFNSRDTVFRGDCSDRGDWRPELLGEAGPTNAVHDALVTALRVPSEDPTVTITEIDPDSIALPGGVGDSYTIVQITMFEGRSIEIKRVRVSGTLPIAECHRDSLV